MPSYRQTPEMMETVAAALSKATPPPPFLRCRCSIILDESGPRLDPVVYYLLMTVTPFTLQYCPRMMAGLGPMHSTAG